MQKTIVALSLVIALGCAVVAEAEEFPLRAKYPQVTTISTAELIAQYDDVLVVDVRSSVEYEICKINSATNILITKASFIDELTKLRAPEGEKPLVFYCNGHTCSKSYKAWVAAEKAGFGNILCYDSGIFEWITTAADKATLLNETPADQKKVVPKATFQAHCLEKEQFLEACAGGDQLIFDIREPLQRKEYEGIPEARNVPFTNFVKLLKEGRLEGESLLIYDSVGKQVKWLQYRLIQHGIKEYNFLSGGARALISE